MKRTIFSYLVIAAAMLVTASCTGDKVYDKYRNTPLAGWEKNDTLTFSVPRMTKAAQYSSNLMLRINDSFPFMALTLIVEQKVIPGNAVTIDTLRCNLIGKSGNFNGQGVSYYQYTFPVTTMPLVPGDSLQISVRHDMKREILPGISDVGIMIEKAEDMSAIQR